MIVNGVMKFLAAIWVVMALNKISDAQLKNGYTFKTSICNGKNGGLLPMFGTCRGYYLCNDGRAVVASCDKNSRFNPQTLHCDDADKVKCTYDISDDNGNDDIDDLDSDQSEFDSSEFEVPSIAVRPSVSVKPPQQAKPIVQLKPNQDLQHSELCLGKRNGVTLPKSNSCTEFYECRSKMSLLRQCPGKQHFSAALRICMKSADAGCSISQKVLQPEEPKPNPVITAGICSEEKEDALVPHRDDCAKFMLCSNMMFLVMDCPTGLHFNDKARRCDYPKLAQCDLQKKKIKKNKRKQLGKSKPRRNQI